MANERLGRLLFGDAESLRRAYDVFDGLDVDLDLHNSEEPTIAAHQSTIEKPVSVSGPGTFMGKATSTLHFEPTEEEGGNR